jgi:hypothetical protein
VATNDPATAHFTAIKTWETQVSHTNQGTRTPTYTQTLEARGGKKKPRWQLVTQLLPDQNTQGGPKYQYKYTQTHNSTQTQKIINKGIVTIYNKSFENVSECV